LNTSEGRAQRPKLLLVASNATPHPFAVPAHFPCPALPEDNPLTDEGIRLGGLLFFDPRLSFNNSQSCASCHQPEAAFTDPARPVSHGAAGDRGTRNSMPLFNLAWKSFFFWDGRAGSLREQVLQPIQNPIEMHSSLDRVVGKLAAARVNPTHERRALRFTPVAPHPKSDFQVRNNDYPSLFADAFGTPEITADRIARSLEQFLLVQVSHTSKFDQVLMGQAEFTEEEKRGFDLFRTEYDPRHGQFGADCFHCHDGRLFRSQNFANNGLDAEFRDQGRFLSTMRDGDKGKFAVPSLRNVALTPPYMHDGRFKTLEEVIDHYTSGVKRSATLDPNLAKHPDGGVPLNASDKMALVAFLKTLTDQAPRLDSVGLRSAHSCPSPHPRPGHGGNVAPGWDVSATAQAGDRAVPQAVPSVVPR
jgi:cytochrome c peroxidase